MLGVHWANKDLAWVAGVPDRVSGVSLFSTHWGALPMLPPKRGRPGQCILQRESAQVDELHALIAQHVCL